MESQIHPFQTFVIFKAKIFFRFDFFFCFCLLLVPKWVMGWVLYKIFDFSCFWIGPPKLPNIRSRVYSRLLSHLLSNLYFFSFYNFVEHRYICWNTYLWKKLILNIFGSKLARSHLSEVKLSNLVCDNCHNFCPILLFSFFTLFWNPNGCCDGWRFLKIIIVSIWLQKSYFNDFNY